MPKCHPYRRRSLPAVLFAPAPNEPNPSVARGAPAVIAGPAPAVPVGPSAFFGSLSVHAKRTDFTSNPFKTHHLASSPNEPNPFPWAGYPWSGLGCPRGSWALLRRPGALWARRRSSSRQTNPFHLQPIQNSPHCVFAKRTQSRQPREGRLLSALPQKSRTNPFPNPQPGQPGPVCTFHQTNPNPP